LELRRNSLDSFEKLRDGPSRKTTSNNVHNLKRFVEEDGEACLILDSHGASK
jgi:hypothetical protein